MEGVGGGRGEPASPLSPVARPALYALQLWPLPSDSSRRPWIPWIRWIRSRLPRSIKLPWALSIGTQVYVLAAELERYRGDRKGRHREQCT